MSVNLIGKLKSIPEKIYAIGAVCVIWQIVAVTKLVDNSTLPPFTSIISKLLFLFYTGDILPHIGASLQRAFLGFLISVVAGVILGFLMGTWERFERILDPVMQVLRNTPALALYPLFILVFGLGELSEVAIIFFGALWPVLMNTIEGVRTVDHVIVKGAKSMGASKFTLFSKVVLPSAFPTMFTGIRLCASRSIIMLVAAEMLGADKGLGYMIFFSEKNYMVVEMYSGIIMLVVIGVVINKLLVSLESKVTHWKESV
ncbi:MAG TPA: ABC transporter permease [Clostridia bacterium]